MPLLCQRREDHVLEGFTIPQRVPRTMMEHAIGDFIGWRLRRCDKTAGTAVTVQFDLHGCPRWFSLWVKISDLTLGPANLLENDSMGSSRSNPNASQTKLALTFCDLIAKFVATWVCDSGFSWRNV